MKQKNVVRLNNGNYVKDWQYSQGHFDVVETDKVEEAIHVDRGHFYFFEDSGAKMLRVETTIKILE